MSEQPVAFDRVTLRRFVRAVRDLFTSEVRWKARGLFALLIAFALTVNGLNVVNSYVGRDFFTAISHRDQAGFVRQAIFFVVRARRNHRGSSFLPIYRGTAWAVLAGVADPTNHR